MSPAVEYILQQVTALSPEEKREFDERFRQEFAPVVAAHRARVKQEIAAKGITEADADEFIAEGRYGAVSK